MSGDVKECRLGMIQIEAFKALNNFNLRVAGKDISLLVGPNGAGKTSTLQALGLLRYVIEGRISEFFRDHGWNPATLLSHIRKSKIPVFIISASIFTPEGRAYFWSCGFQIDGCRLAGEHISIFDGGEIEDVFVFRGKTPKFLKWQEFPALTPGHGSLLTTLRIEDHPDPEHRKALMAVKAWAQGIVSLELLSPLAIRGSMARGKVSDIGVRGERLGAFIANLKSDAKERILHRLERFYPSLAGLSTTAKRAGWIDFKIAESFSGHNLSVGTEHVSDGFLRLLALAAIPELPRTTSLVLLDEAENGIDPLILPDFLEMIARESRAQIVATTHSPILVNRFPPECVHLLSRAEDGQTVTASLADIPELQEELEFRGPGEIWAHSSQKWLSTLVAQADARRKAERAAKG